MANRTVKDAKSLHGTNPQYLVEKIIRTRIYESRFWKEDCFGLSAELVVDKGIELRFIGGVYSGNVKPSPFLCLTLKMLQIQPDKDIIIEFISQDAFKYVRALGAFYLRLTAPSIEIWKYLEPLYNDFRKLRLMDRMGKFTVIHMDEFIDMLLRDDRVFDVILPRISKRQIHEEAEELEPRVSALEDDLEEIESEEEVAIKVNEEKKTESEVRRGKEKHGKERKEAKEIKEKERHRRHGSESRERSPSYNKRHRSPSDRERRRNSPSSSSRRRSRSRDRDLEHRRDHGHERHRDHREARDGERKRRERSYSPAHRSRK